MALGDDTYRKKVMRQINELAKTDEAKAERMWKEFSDLHPTIWDSRVGHSSMMAESSADEAAHRLQLAAEYLRELDHHFPYGLGRFLADAFDVAALKSEPEERARVLGEELGLTARNRRPASPYIGYAMRELVSNGLSQNQAAAQVAEQHGVSVTTAKRYYRRQKALKGLASLAEKMLSTATTTKG